MIAGKDEPKMLDIALGILVKRKYQVWFDDKINLFYAKKVCMHSKKQYSLF